MEIERTALPGIGIFHTVTTGRQQRMGVVSHLDGSRDVVLYDPDDPQSADRTVTLDPNEAHQVADLLDATITVDHVTDLEQEISGVTVARLRLPAGSAYDARPLGDTRARTRTGASIVAVARDGKVLAAPGPDFVLHAGDKVIAVGDHDGITALTEILAASVDEG